MVEKVKMEVTILMVSEEGDCSESTKSERRTGVIGMDLETL